MVASVHGRAGGDGQLRTAASGKVWCRVSVAVELGVDRESGERLIEWFQVLAFGRIAEDLSKVKKGEMVSAFGRVEKDRWKAADGAERSGWKLICDAVITARSARPGGGRPKTTGSSKAAQAASQRIQEPTAEVPFNDELPF